MELIWMGAMYVVGAWLGTLALGVGLFGLLVIVTAIADWIRRA